AFKILVAVRDEHKATNCRIGHERGGKAKRGGDVRVVARRVRSDLFNAPVCERFFASRRKLDRWLAPKSHNAYEIARPCPVNFAVDEIEDCGARILSHACRYIHEKK